MTTLFAAFFILALAPAPAFAAACLELPSDRILVRDLLPAVPELQPLDPNLVLGYSPVPGTTRVVRRPELASWMRNKGLTPDPASLPASVCLERATALLTAPQIRDALAAAIDNPNVDLQVIDFSRFPLPPSTLEFPLSGLSRPSPAKPDAPVLWLGRAGFDEGRHVTVWATVLLREKRQVLVAVTPIPAGHEIAPDATRLEDRFVFPYPASPAFSPAGAEGKVSRRSLAAGDVVTPDLLLDPPAVRRGEQTSVTVQDGAIQIIFDAKADSAGARGDAIVLVNPSSGQKFRGTIVERRRVVVQLTGNDT